MSLPVRECQFDSGSSYDAAVVSVGYEERSSFLMRSGLKAESTWAFPFQFHKEGKYQANLGVIKGTTAKIIDVPDADYRKVLEGLLREARPRTSGR